MAAQSNKTLAEEIKSIFYNAFAGINEVDDKETRLREFRTNSKIAVENLLELVVPIFLKESNRLLIDYNKHYYSLRKEYKEELKFKNSHEEDLRKEYAKFFGENLKEVAETLNATKIDNKTRIEWIKSLVSSYTGSIDQDVIEKLLQDYENKNSQVNKPESKEEKGKKD